MSKKKSCELTVAVDRQDMAEVWRGPIEQAELYNERMVNEGLTMAPIEKT